MEGEGEAAVDGVGRRRREGGRRQGTKDARAVRLLFSASPAESVTPVRDWFVWCGWDRSDQKAELKMETHNEKISPEETNESSSVKRSPASLYGFR